MDATMFKAGVSGSARSWRGVIRNAKGVVVWTCPHHHANRDRSNHYSEAACSCARRHLEAATNPQYGAWLALSSINNPMARPQDVRRINDAKARAPEIRAALGMQL